MRSLVPILILCGLSAQAAVLTRTVGAVEEEVFTSRQVLLSSLVERISAGKEPSPAAEPEANARDLAALLLEAAVAREAENFSVEAVNVVHRDALAARVRTFLNSAPAWKKLELSDEEIKKTATRKLAARSLIRLRSETLKGTVSDAEAQSYFDKNRTKFGQLPFSSFKESIKKFLAEQQLEERLRSWFDIVRRKHKAREFKEDATTSAPAPGPPVPPTGPPSHEEAPAGAAVDGK